MRVIDPAALDGRRILLFGDSITDDGTYVSQLLFLLGRLRPAWRLGHLVSVGLASENLSGLSEKEHPFPRPCLRERLDRALKAFNPETVFACYGMNDGIYCPQSDERLYAFRAGVANMLDRVSSFGVERIVLMTPPPFDPQPVAASLRPAGRPEAEYSYKNPYEDYASVLRDYSRWLLGLEGDEVSVIDLNGPLSEALRRGRASNPGFVLSPDGIHPGFLGHLLMTSEILRAFGVKLDASLEELALSMPNDAEYVKVDERRKTLSEAWRSFIGFTRETTVRRKSIDDVLAATDWGL